MKKYFVVFLLGVLLIACKGRVQPEAPDLITAHNEHKSILSKLNVPLVLKIDQLKQVLNEQLVGNLYEDNSYTNNGNDNLKVFVSKNGAIELDAFKNELIYQIPLKCKVKGRYPMLVTELKAQSTFEFTVKLKSKLDIDNKWNLTTETLLVNYSLDNNPKLDFGVVSVKLGGVVKLLLDNFLDDAVPIIDQQIKKNFDTRNYVEGLWQTIQKPMQIDDDYNSWLKVIPKYFVFAPIIGDHKHIKLNIGINGFVEVVTGSEPGYDFNPILPDLVRNKDFSDDFALSLKSELYYEKMNEILKETIVGYEYEYGKKKKIMITDAQVFGNGGDLVVKVKFSGNLKGEFYMNGKPKFDSESKSIYVDDLDFDIKSKQVLVKVADIVLKGTFRKQINKYLRFSLREQLDNMQLYIEEYLKSQQLDQTVSVQIGIDKASLEQILMKEKSMVTILNIGGKLNIKYGK